MKYILLNILILSTLIGTAQSTNDSVEVRIHNMGKHNIQNITITVNGKYYTYTDIKKINFSDYQKMPYIWSTGNSLEITLERKRFLRRKDIVTIKQFPIDHIGDHKFTNGKYVMEITTKICKKDSQIKQEVIFETKK